MNKYNNKKIEFNGIKYDSKMEYEYHQFLLTDSSIKEIVLQPLYMLLPAYKDKDLGINNMAVMYRADFEVWYINGDCEVIDVKGFETPDFRIKKKMFESKFKKKLKTVTYSKIDGGWVTLEELKFARKGRKRTKTLKEKENVHNFIPAEDGIRKTAKGNTYKGSYNCSNSHSGNRYLRKEDEKTVCHKCGCTLNVIHYENKNENNDYWIAY